MTPQINSPGAAPLQEPILAPNGILTLSWSLFFNALAELSQRFLGPLPYAKLPAASANLGVLAIVTDSNTVTWGATIAAGGANKVLGWSNGTNWTVIGK